MYFICFIYLTRSGHTPSFSLPGILLSTFYRGKQQQTGLLPPLSMQKEDSSCRRDFFRLARPSGLLLLCSVLKIHDTFFHLENLLPKLIAYFHAMKGICMAPYILAQHDLHQVHSSTTVSLRQRELQPIGKIIILEEVLAVQSALKAQSIQPSGNSEHNCFYYFLLCTRSAKHRVFPYSPSLTRQPEVGTNNRFLKLSAEAKRSSPHL